MQIIVTPNDIIQRCLWSNYVKLIVYDKKEDYLKKIVEENLPFTLTEEQSYAIGLIKIIETDNLVHRFNEHILEVLQIKSSIINEELFIIKNILVKEIDTYMNRFPSYYKPTFNYKKGLDDLTKYIEVVRENLKGVNTVTVQVKDKLATYYNSKDIRNCLMI